MFTSNPRVIALVLLGIGILVASYWFLLTTTRSAQTHQLPSAQAETRWLQEQQLTGELVDMEIAGKTITVEVANTAATIAQGLSGRTEIGSDGMLFVFPQSRSAAFWMPDMQFDLDMIWLKNSEVLGVTADVPAPAPGTPPAHLPTYPSPGVVDMVLEMPAGTAAAWGIEPGTSVSFFDRK